MKYKFYSGYIILSIIFSAFGITNGQGIRDSVFNIGEVKVFSETAVEDRGIIKLKIDKKLMEHSVSSDLSEAISDFSTVFIKSSGPGSISSISLRGTAASHTRVEWNGVSLNNPMLGQADLSLIPVFLADEIDILPGGSSLSSGPGALGGSIQIQTQPRWSENFYGSINMGMGSFHHFKTYAEIGGRRGKFHSRIKLFSNFSENNFKYSNRDTGGDFIMEQKNAQYNKQGLLHELYYKSGKGSILSIKTWYQDSERHFPALTTYEGRNYDEVQKDNELRVALSLKNYFSDFQMQTNFATNLSDISHFSASFPQDETVIQSDSENSIRSFYFSNQHEWDLSQKFVLKGVVNADYHQVNNFNNLIDTGYSENRLDMGYSLSIHSEISKEFSLFALNRFQFADNNVLPLMPSAGFEFHPLKARFIKFTGNLSRNYHLPGLNDLYWVPNGNPDLKPEEGYSGDISIRLLSNIRKINVVSAINFHYSAINNWISWTPGNMQLWSPENIDKVIARGSEIIIGSKYEGEIINLDLNINYGYTRTSNVSEDAPWSENKEKQLIYVPLHKANTNLVLRYQNFQFHYSFIITGRRFTTSSNEDTRHDLDPYDLHKIRLKASFPVKDDKLSLGFMVNNLFNRHYQTILYRAMPFRNYFLLLSYDF